MIEFEEMYNESERIYKKDYSTGEYCHEQSFKWGFQEGVKFAEKTLTKWHKPDEIPSLDKFNMAKNIIIKDEYGFFIGYYNHDLKSWFDSYGNKVKNFVGWKEIK